MTCHCYTSLWKSIPGLCPSAVITPTLTPEVCVTTVTSRVLSTSLGMSPPQGCLTSPLGPGHCEVAPPEEQTLDSDKTNPDSNPALARISCESLHPSLNLSEPQLLIREMGMILLPTTCG